MRAGRLYMDEDLKQKEAWQSSSLSSILASALLHIQLFIDEKLFILDHLISLIFGNLTFSSIGCPQALLAPIKRMA